MNCTFSSVQFGVGVRFHPIEIPISRRKDFPILQSSTHSVHKTKLCSPLRLWRNSPISGLGLLYQAPPFEAWFQVSRHLYSLRWEVVSLSPNPQPPTWRTRVSLLVWIIPFVLSGKGGPTSSYAAAGIALRVIWPYKPHHYVRVETFIFLFFLESFHPRK
jgi:hypothetical protein